jgi:hypothetical protein
MATQPDNIPVIMNIFFMLIPVYNKTSAKLRNISIGAANFQHISFWTTAVSGIFAYICPQNQVK